MTPLERLTNARSSAVERIAQTADEQAFTGVVGEADVGKTVLLHTALERLGDDGWTIVALDLDGASSPNRLAWRWARELTRAVAGTVALSHVDALSPDMWPASTRNALLRLPSQLGSDVARLAEASHPPRGVGKPESLEGPARATLELAERQRLLVVIDHLEAPKAAGLGSPDAEQLLWRLRSRGQYQRNLHVVVCARPPAQDLASGAKAAYHLDGRWLNLDAPTPREFSQATDADATTSEAVHARTSGHPRATIELLTELLQRPLREREPIDAAIARVAERHVDLTRRYMQHARSVHRFGAHLLLAVAQGFGPYEATPEIDAGEISHAMTRLHLNGLVRRTGPRGWALSDPRVGWNLGGPARQTPSTFYSSDTTLTTDVDHAVGEPPPDSAVWNELTTGQQRILAQLVNGYTNAEIADALGLSVSTVKTHLRNIYRQLGVSTRREALRALDDTRADPALPR